jgi:hypothetical protein
MTLKQAVEKHRNWLRFYSNVARLIGWLLVVEGMTSLVYGQWILLTREELPFSSDNPLFTLSEMKFRAFLVEPFTNMILPGIFALLVSQFFRFLLNNNPRPGWLLRKGELVLYIGTLVIALNSLFALRLFGLFFNQAGGNSFSKFLILIVILPTVLPIVVELLILVGLAQALRRVIPIIQEFKSLA